MKKENEEDLRVRLKEGLKEQFEAVRNAKGMTQVSAVNALVEWFVKQDGRYQSHILGQIVLTAEEICKIAAGNASTPTSEVGTA